MADCLALLGARQRPRNAPEEKDRRQIPHLVFLRKLLLQVPVLLPELDDVRGHHVPVWLPSSVFSIFSSGGGQFQQSNLAEVKEEQSLAGFMQAEGGHVCGLGTVQGKGWVSPWQGEGGSKAQKQKDMASEFASPLGLGQTLFST